MAATSVDRLYGRSMTLDVCQPCQLVWFDGSELLQMAPAATLQLLTVVTGEPGAARHPLRETLECPYCRRRLDAVHDSQRGTRFSYARCPEGHGRLLTLYQFLRAKNFVRPLGAAEVEDLRRHIRQVNCANCGAPVDVGRDTTCRFCRTPIAVLDPDQLRKALDELRADLDRKPTDPTLPLRLAIERLRAERETFDPTAARSSSVLDLFFGDVADPIATGLRALRSVLKS